MLLEIKDVCKVYKGKVKANDNISLSIAAGEVFGLLGPNGAGKTTLVNQIIGLTMPTSGTIILNGVDVVANPGYARDSCSFQAQTQVPISGLNTLQAIELGYGTCWIGAFNETMVKELLRVPEERKVVVCMTFGKPKGKHLRVGRKAIEDFIYLNSYAHPWNLTP